MRKLYFLFVIIVLFGISCERKNNVVKNNNTDENKNQDLEDWQIQMEKYKDFKIDYTDNKYGAFDNNKVANYDIKRRLFVTNINGLEERVSPSVDSRVLRKYLYCEMIYVHDKSEEPVTIDGVTGYWYKMNDLNSPYTDTSENIYSYVFGGYLSEELPKDAPRTILNGYWNGTGRNENLSYLFSGNTYIIWAFFGEMEERGTFSVVEDKIIFNQNYFIAYHFGDGWQKIDPIKSRTHTFNLTGTELKISKSSIEDEKYNPSEYNFFEKAELDF